MDWYMLILIRVLTNKWSDGQKSRLTTVVKNIRQTTFLWSDELSVVLNCYSL